jgi:hypothetical protein
LPSDFINTSRHTHSDAQLKGRAMQIHAVHYGAPSHWFTWHKGTQKHRSNQSQDYLFSHHTPTMKWHFQGRFFWNLIQL